MLSAAALPSGAALEEQGARADDRFRVLRTATELQLQREREQRELAALSAKMEQNKVVLNELRFGPVKQQTGGAGPLGDQFWVSSGNMFLAMGAGEVESLVMQNQMAVRQLKAEAEERVRAIDEAFEEQVEKLEASEQQQQQQQQR